MLPSGHPTLDQKYPQIFLENPNILPNPSSNFNRQFFELVQKSDDENEKKIFFSREMAKP